MDLTANNFAKSDMAIRKPIQDVFNAFIDPAITTKFWFTKSTGRLEVGNHLDWTWEMYNLTVPVFVKEIVDNKKIVLEMGSGAQQSKVEWQFQELNPNKTFVIITNYDLPGTGDDLINQIRDSTGGFTLVLAGLKAYLEHGVELNLVLDKFPKELMGE